LDEHVKGNEIYSACRVYERDENVYSRILVLKPERKKPLEKCKYRWKDNIKTDLNEIGSDVVEWIHLAKNGIHWRDYVKTIIKLLRL
jgi:hypothetical protein